MHNGIEDTLSSYCVSTSLSPCQQILNVSDLGSEEIMAQEHPPESRISFEGKAR